MLKRKEHYGSEQWIVYIICHVTFKTLQKKLFVFLISHWVTCGAVNLWSSSQCAEAILLVSHTCSFVTLVLLSNTGSVSLLPSVMIYHCASTWKPFTAKTYIMCLLPSNSAVFLSPCHPSSGYTSNWFWSCILSQHVTTKGATNGVNVGMAFAKRKLTYLWKQQNLRYALLESEQWNSNDHYEKPMNIPMKKFSLVDHIPWNTHGKPGKFSWPINEWVFMGTTHEKSMNLYLWKCLVKPWNYFIDF